MATILRGLRRAQGYVCISDPEAGVTERDCITCSHCQTIVTVKPGAPPSDFGGFCYSCAKMVCPKCVGKPCTPFEAIADALERDYERRRSYGLA